MRRLTAYALAAAALLCVPAQAASKPFGTRTLERGDRGHDVRVLQKTLTRLGLRLQADGAFGRITARKVRRYERRERIRVDARVSRGQARGMFRRIGRKLPARKSGVSRPEPDATVSARFPIQGRWTAGDGFGDRGGGHDGIDLLARCGTPLVAPEAGKVVYVASHARAGHYVVIRSAASGEEHVFMHLRRRTPLGKGDAVAAGERIGAVGDSGNATACMLHFEIWTAPGWQSGGRARNPVADLRRWGG